MTNAEVVTNPDSDEMFRDHEALAAASSASIAGKIAFGPNAGHMDAVVRCTQNAG